MPLLLWNRPANVESPLWRLMVMGGAGMWHRSSVEETYSTGVKTKGPSLEALAPAGAAGAVCAPAWLLVLCLLGVLLVQLFGGIVRRGGEIWMIWVNLELEKYHMDPVKLPSW